jgi:Zn-dependent M28 family amino/carboxypeptidase
MTRRTTAIYLAIIGVLLALVIIWYAVSFRTVEPNTVIFDGQRALSDVQTQVAFGSRMVGSEGHAKVEEWIRTELESAGWTVTVQDTQQMGHPVRNIIAKRNDTDPQILLGAHYDTRMIADQDPDPANHTKPVPGANDGASGVAVLVELARTLPDGTAPLWLVFFDTEDNGNIAGWDWILGSRAFVEVLQFKPRAVVVVDMIGDADLNIYLERNSDKELRTEIWNTAASLGYDKVFITQEKHSMLDDHTPFLQAGIPAVDIIDFDYPYWHTVEDTPDKISAESLQAVGRTLSTWITGQNQQP